MSITNQKYYTVQFAEENQKKNVKANNKAGSEPKTIASSASGNDLDAKITKQGDLIRDLKAKKASKVIT